MDPSDEPEYQQRYQDERQEYNQTEMNTLHIIRLSESMIFIGSIKYYSFHNCEHVP